MKKISIGIIDYGIGNHATLVHCLRRLDFQVTISRDTLVLDSIQVLILPGVGAFPSAMSVLNKLNLTDYLLKKASCGQPIIGICLGMHLLTTGSYEHGYTPGLNLITGLTVPFPDRLAHTGWNEVNFQNKETSWAPSGTNDYYFNHSYYCQTSSSDCVALTNHSESFPSIIQKGNIVGIQFHPEKSQVTGKLLLKNLIVSLANA